MLDWRAAIARHRNRRLLVVDTPPGVPDEEARDALRSIAVAAHLVFMPCLPDPPTLQALAELGQMFTRLGAPLMFVLNRVVQGRRSVAGARRILAERADLCPIEIPAREQVAWLMADGTAAVESGGAQDGRDEFLAL